MEFNSHRTKDGQANDWDSVSPEKRNLPQRIAAASFGLVTPANILDILTLGADAEVNQQMIVGGHRAMETAARADNIDDFRAGARRKIGGLIADIALLLPDALDGALATTTGTRSRMGEAVDGGGDFLRAGLRAWSRFQIGELSVADLVVLVGPKAANAVTASVAKLTGREFHSTGLAKGAEVARGVMLAAADLTEIIKTSSQLSANGAAPLSELMSPGYEPNNQLSRWARRVRKISVGVAAVAGVGASLDNIAKFARNGEVK